MIQYLSSFFVIVISLIYLIYYWWASERFARSLNIENLHSSRPPSFLLAYAAVATAGISINYLLILLSS